MPADGRADRVPSRRGGRAGSARRLPVRARRRTLRGLGALCRAAASRQTLIALIGRRGRRRRVASLRIEPLAPADWVTLSQGKRGPVRAGRFLVHGSHDRGRVPKLRLAIEIDAGQAFGTAHHASTRGCLLALDDVLKRDAPARHPRYRHRHRHPRHRRRQGAQAKRARKRQRSARGQDRRRQRQEERRGASASRADRARLRAMPSFAISQADLAARQSARACPLPARAGDGAPCQARRHRHPFRPHANPGACHRGAHLAPSASSAKSESFSMDGRAWC